MISTNDINQAGDRSTWGMRRLRLLTWIGTLASIPLIVMAIVVALGLLGLGEAIGIKEHSDPGVALATAGLAIFTGLLFFAGAVAAGIAQQEIAASTDVNSATLALQLDNRFVSDRALRIRHGAVSFLAEVKEDLNELKSEFDCRDNISPYSTDQKSWHGLNSDLIDIFNYYNWIGYLALEKPATITPEVVYQKFGPWIITYYQICEDVLDTLRDKYKARWPYLEPLYRKLTAIEGTFYSQEENYSEKRTTAEIKDFLRREHVRSHRGSNPGTDVYIPHVLP